MVTVLSQDLVIQASSGACLQRGSGAPGPLRQPALCICCISESVGTACIARSTPLSAPSLPRLTEAMCSPPSLLLVMLSGVYFLHGHTHNAPYPCADLDFHTNKVEADLGSR